MNQFPVFTKRSLIALAPALLLIGSPAGFAQTNPAAQSLPMTQSFGTTTFTTMPAGFAAWNGVSGAAVTTQALAEASSPTGNATVAVATAAQTGGGIYGYATSSNGRAYIQTSSNTTNGANQVAMALNCTGWDSVVVAYDVEIISAQPRTIGVVCQYRVGTTGTWTALTPSIGVNPYSQVGGTTGVKTNVTATLPSLANNQPVVQVRWAVWRGTETGGSSGAAIDNVSATGTPTGDTTPPTIATYIPANNATGVAATTNLIANFSETVNKGSGDITVKLVSDNTTVFTIPVTDAAVALAGTTATITLPSSLAGTTAYYVNIAAGAFKDLANLNFAGISDAATWTFTTAALDTAGPMPTPLSPADDSSGAFPNANLVVTYNENIYAGTGTVLVKKLSDDSLVDTIAIPSGQVQISGDTATINPATVLQWGTSYYVEITAGAFKDIANNPNAAISGNTAWNFTTNTSPQVVISQYYEGTASTDRYIELKNLTGSPLSLTGYRLAVWSDTAPSDNEGWKSGTGTTTRVTSLDGYTIPANGSFLVAETGATTPGYAANNTDLVTDTGMATAFNGDDSVVLYSGTGFTQNEVVDALSFSANQGENLSIYRISTAQGFDFVTGTSYQNFTGTWAAKSLTEVNNAAYGDEWYLRAIQEPKNLTLAIAPTSFSEGAGAAAATATVSRTGDTTAELAVTVNVSDTTEADAALTVAIPAGQASAQFNIDAVNDLYLDGNKTVTVVVSAATYTPDSETVTVQDELTDAVFPVVINEVDADQPLGDSNEYIELYNNSASPVSLDGVVVVLYNGSNDLSYKTIDLTGKTIGANDYFVIGSATVPNLDQEEFSTDGIQNGADAVALYLGTVSEFPNGTPVSTTNGTLVDAVVYDTNDADDIGLINALTPGKPQIDEGSTGTISEANSVSRNPDGGASFATNLFVSQMPTPGATNVLPGYLTWATANVGGQTADLDFDGDGLDNGIEYFMGTAGNASTANPGVVGGAVTWPRAPGTTISSFKVEVSTNLTTWENATVNYSANLAISPTQVVFTMPASPAQFFVRLSVTP